MFHTPGVVQVFLALLGTAQHLDEGIPAPDKILDIVQLADLKKIKAGIFCYQVPPPRIVFILMPAHTIVKGIVWDG